MDFTSFVTRRQAGRLGRFLALLEFAGPLLVLALLLRFSAGRFLEAPYAGFTYNQNTAQVVELYVETKPETALLPGDTLLQLGSVSWTTFAEDPFQTFFEDARPGTVIPIRIERDGRELAIPWTFPGFTWTELLQRLISQWWLSYVFWVAGLATLLFVRPKDTRWRLLIAFNFVTALWLSAGGVTEWHIDASKLIFRSALWLSVPVYLHLHWVFPKPLGRLPTWLLVSTYTIAVLLGVAEWYQLLPSNAYQSGFLIAITGSILLMGWRLLFRREQRRAVVLLGGAVLLLFVPLLAVGLVASLDITAPVLLQGGALLAFPAVPGAYFYIIYRDQLGRRQERAQRLIRLYLASVLLSTLFIIILMATAIWLGFAGSQAFVGLSVLLLAFFVAVLGFAPFFFLTALGNASSSPTDTSLSGLALRANRLLTPYLFFIVVGSALAFVVLLLENWLPLPTLRVFIGIFITLFAGVSLYQPWRRLIDRHLLRIKLPPSQLLESYAERITTSLDRDSLVQLLTDEILPSLLIRQSALLCLNEMGGLELIYGSSITPEQVPKEMALPTPHQPGEVTIGQEWVRLLLPLRVSGQTIGFWLLGRRDPDDWYGETEMPMFRALANQTAIALTNILQSESLHSLYQENIDRHEMERTRLALDLHDDILSELAVLALYADEKTTAPPFHEAYEALVTRLRETIGNLRPPMLNYGLYPALEELVEELSDRIREKPKVVLDVSPADHRYPVRVEQHLFRIVQQAAENALQHAQAQTIQIEGRLEPEGVRLTVADDGKGVPPGLLDRAALLAHKHYGLVGMQERAVIIRAQLHIHSALGHGTHITITWRAEDYSVDEADGETTV